MARVIWLHLLKDRNIPASLSILIPAIRKVRQEDWETGISTGYTARACLNIGKADLGVAHFSPDLILGLEQGASGYGKGRGQRAGGSCSAVPQGNSTS